MRAFLAEHVTAEVLEHERLTGDGFNERVHLALGEKGWIMPAWPASGAARAWTRSGCASWSWR